MRRRPLAFAAALTCVVLSPSGRAFAQTGAGVGADPFSFYYGYYLPHQAAIAAQPTPLDTINQVQAYRQRASQADRAALYDPISPYGDAEDDFARPFGDRRANERRIRSMDFRVNQNYRGHGPPSHYSASRTTQYFPTMRSGRGPNLNVSAPRGPRSNSMGAMGAMGMGGMSFPGPR